jgi:hypothetical protein
MGRMALTFQDGDPGVGQYGRQGFNCLLLELGGGFAKQQFDGLADAGITTQIRVQGVECPSFAPHRPNETHPRWPGRRSTVGIQIRRCELRHFPEEGNQCVFIPAFIERGEHSLRGFHLRGRAGVRRLVEDGSCYKVASPPKRLERDDRAERVRYENDVSAERTSDSKHVIGFRFEAVRHVFGLAALSAPRRSIAATRMPSGRRARTPPQTAPLATAP